jgi:hypothetical protein
MLDEQSICTLFKIIFISAHHLVNPIPDNDIVYEKLLHAPCNIYINSLALSYGIISFSYLFVESCKTPRLNLFDDVELF